ncbi:unnamed protein product [Pelagomonas calceolata]|uniref:Uncharacterized protein n=2 Tax=Pelagomonas calceolata TaxID=35677 RepID=A0A8J2X3N4_9STRA|nr:unnamed protein product [Pelagomonas calceolata]
MAAKEPKLQGAVEDGKPLLIFIDENDKTGAKAVTLKELNIKIDGVSDDAKVQFLVDEPKGTKNFQVHYAFVGGKVRPLKTLSTFTVHGHARSIRGWRVDFNYVSQKRLHGTEEQTWSTGPSNCGAELRSDIEDRDEKSAFEKAKKLVAGSSLAPRVKVTCARVRCRVVNVNGQLACDFTGEGDDALEDATAKAGWQALCNAISFLVRMKTNKVFLALSPDLQRDATLALEGKRYDYATFEGHGHVTMAVPLGTRVEENVQGVEQWYYRDASGDWKPANDRADAEKKALLNQRVQEEARRIEQHKQFVQAIDADLGESNAAATLTTLPNCFASVDRRLGRGFNAGSFVVLGDALLIVNCLLRRAGCPTHFFVGAPGDTLHELALLCGNGEWVPRTLFDRMTVLYQKCADEERTTNVKAIVRFNQVATEQDLDVELFQVVYNHRCDAKQIGVLREWGGFKTALLGEDSTRASVYWTLNIVKAAADREPNTLTINPFVQYFYALATGRQMAFGMEMTRRKGFQAWFEAKYGEGTTHRYGGPAPQSFPAPAAAGIGGVAVAAADLPPEMVTAAAKVRGMPRADAEAYVHQFIDELQSSLRASAAIAPAALAPAAPAPAPAPAPKAPKKAKKKRKSAPKASKSAAATATAPKKSKKRGA